MKTPHVLLIVMILLGLLMIPAPQHTEAQSSETTFTAQDLYVAVNQSLIDADARPLGRSDTLDMIAQDIANELSTTRTYDGVPRELADEFGFPRWPDNGQRVINEAVNYIGIESPDFFAETEQETFIDILQNTFYREMGVAVASYQAVAAGTVQNVYVVVMGARPNVLPVVINDGAETVYSRDVDLYIHNEFSLAYETEPDIIQRALRFRIANSEAGLDDAQPIEWENNNYALDWQLTEDFGEKEVWVEFEDEKGVRVRSSTTVEFADPATAPTPEPSPEPEDTTLNMTYRDDTFTLVLDSNRPTARLQEVFFQWEIDGLSRAYEIENPDGFQEVNLEAFSTDDCLQIRWVGLQSIQPVEGCTTVFLEAQRFTEIEDVFWNTRVATFEVWDGPNLLGTCEIAAGSCSVALE